MTSPKLPKWQIRYANAFDNACANPMFEARATAAKKLTGHELMSELARMITDFGLPVNLLGVLEHFVQTGNLNYNLVQPAAKIISEYDRVALPAKDPQAEYKFYQTTRTIGQGFEVKIVLQPDVTKDEVYRVLTDNWKDIGRLLERSAATERTRSRKRHKESEHQLIVSLVDEGKTPGEVAHIVNNEGDFTAPVTAADIRLIYSRKKKGASS